MLRFFFIKFLSSPHQIIRFVSLFIILVNGSKQTMDVHMFPRERITKWLELFRARKGDTIMRILKRQRTRYPSVQGVWTPFTNKDASLAVESFPSAKYSALVKQEKTATDKILEIYNQLKQTTDHPTKS